MMAVGDGNGGYDCHYELEQWCAKCAEAASSVAPKRDFAHPFVLNKPMTYNSKVTFPDHAISGLMSKHFYVDATRVSLYTV